MPLFSRKPAKVSRPRQRHPKDPKTELGNMLIKALKDADDPHLTLRMAASALDMDMSVFDGPATPRLTLKQAEEDAMAAAIRNSDYGVQMAGLMLEQKRAEIEQLRRGPQAEGEGGDILDRLINLQEKLGKLGMGPAAGGQKVPESIGEEIVAVMKEAIPMVREGVLAFRERQALEHGVNPYAPQAPAPPPAPRLAPPPAAERRVLPPANTPVAPPPAPAEAPAAQLVDQLGNPITGPDGTPPPVETSEDDSSRRTFGGEVDMDFERAIEAFEIMKSREPADPLAAADGLLTMAESDDLRGDGNLLAVIDWLCQPGTLEGVVARLRGLAMARGELMQRRIQALAEPREWATPFIQALLDDRAPQAGEQAV